MIEKTVIDYLYSKTSAGTNVFMEMPERLPEKYLVIEKTGSSTEDRIVTSTITIQSFAGSMEETAELNEEVKQAMDNLPEEDVVFSCRLNSDYNYTDPGTMRYRYQAVFQISH